MKLDKKHINIFLFWVCNILIPLCIGVVIYLLTGGNVIFLRPLRQLFGNPSAEFDFWGCDWIRGYIPDFCWSFSLSFTIAVWLERSIPALKYSLLISLALSIGLEFLQLYHVTIGTFDILDILVEVGGCLAAHFIILSYYRRRKK